MQQAFKMAKANGTTSNAACRRNGGPLVSRSVASERVELSKHCHPPYLVMVKEAIVTLDEPRGSSIRKITTCIHDAYSDELSGNFKNSVQLAVRRGVSHGALEQTGGKGPSAKFRMSKKVNLVYEFQKTNVLACRILKYYDVSPNYGYWFPW